MNDVVQMLDRRCSLRRFGDKPVTDEELDAILHSAVRAPTAGNMMLYSIIHVQDQKLKETLAKTCDNQPFIAKAPVVLVFVIDGQRWHDYYQLCDTASYCRRTDRTFYKPHMGDFLLGANDAIIAAQNAVVAGESLGIGSCYIGDIMENFEQHRELLHLPEFCFPVAMLCMGHYPDNYQPKRRERLPKESVVFTDHYQRLDHEELLHTFAAEEQELPKPNGLNADNFGQFMYGRKSGAAFFQEMDRSIRAALEYWQGGPVQFK